MPATRRRSKAIRLGTLAFALAFVLSGFEVSAQEPAAGDPFSGSATDAGARGLVHQGLKRVEKKNARCRRGFQARTSDGKRICTHGPDAAPQGVDVRRKRATKELQSAQVTSAASRPLPCYGDGSSGPRIQAIYARATDVPDRSSEVVALIPGWAAGVDAAYSASAAQTGGTRHVLWASTAGCALDVDTVVLSAAGDDSLTATINELKALGYNRADRKYLVWTDATRYCGIAEAFNDDQSGSGNVHNFGPTFARVDSACWGRDSSTEAHELMHMLGGIQASAPHATGGWHCTDESDRMCLADGSGGPLSYVCPGGNEALFDCGHDDYFSTSPPAGSYLATHWNAANNVFLSSVVPDACWTELTQVTAATERRRHRGRRGRRKAPQPQSADSTLPCVPQTAFATS